MSDAREEHEADIAHPLIDSELWGPLENQILSARRRIDLTQLLFEPAFKPRGRVIADELKAATDRGVRVRILVNENAAIPDSYDELRSHFEGTLVDVRALPMTPNVLHAKLFLIDEEAFLIDAPFEQKYADERTHPFDSSRRGEDQPLHSVSMHLTGPIVGRLTQMFDALWAGTPLPPRTQPMRGTGRKLRLMWSAPAGVWADTAAGGIIEEYERAIASAESFLYIENQYLTSPRIVAAIDSALKRNPRLEVILALNEHMDVPTYDTWQDRRLESLNAPHERLGVFSLWAPRRVAPDAALRPIYIHSKFAIVDDRWMTTGSANLDSISLHDADEFGVVAPRNIEVNVAFDDPPFIAAQRRRLWGEHLGDEHVWRAEAPPEGWLALWRRVADENLARFRTGQTEARGHVFPYHAVASRGRDQIARPRHAPTA